MILFFYNLLLRVGLVLSAPWWWWRIRTTEKYREGIQERLGEVPEPLLASDDGRPVIWLHAVSVGEVLAVSRFLEEMERAFPECRPLISTTTRTGQTLARERFGAERVFYCPLDLPKAVNAYMEALRPRMLVLAETEFWPNLLDGCFRRGIPVVVVNARVSDRSWPRYWKLRKLWRPILDQLALVLPQSELDAERLRAIGCRPDRVVMVGNLKFDVRAAAESEATRALRATGLRSRFLVAGSTVEGEEPAVLAAWQEALGADPRIVLVLAPRHPERFNAVATLLAESGVPWVRRSSWKGLPVESLPELRFGEVVLLDTIGELASVYSLAAIAFVGGSVVEAGGHNPLEPAQFGVPIVMGPHYSNFRAITEELRAHRAVRIAAADKLAKTFFDLLYDETAAHAMGERARLLFEEEAGATARSVEAIAAVLRGAGATTVGAGRLEGRE
jgi:3-deoxy-D-manno-octulosonic-acid transferase